MPAIPLFLVEKAAAMGLEAALPHLLGQKLPASKAAGVCRLYRRIAICHLLQSGTADRFFVWLAMGGQAFRHWLEGAPGAEKRGSLVAPYFDAVACGDDATAAAIARAGPTSHSPGEEYEEEHLFPRFLMGLHSLQAPRLDLAGAVERFEALADGSDPRAPLCRALLERDQGGFDRALEAVVEAWRAELRERAASGLLSPDDEGTTARVSVELLAVLRIAELAGLATEVEVPLAPSVARGWRGARLPAPDAWKSIPSYWQLG